MDLTEIKAGELLIGYVIATSDGLPDETTFLTKPDANLQVGFVAKSEKEDVDRHDHKPVERSIVGTAEVLVVMKGSGEIDFFDLDRAFISSHRFGAGDVLVMLAGGHGFRFDEGCVLLEVKQGPYPGLDEKERF